MGFSWAPPSSGISFPMNESFTCWYVNSANRYASWKIALSHFQVDKDMIGKQTDIEQPTTND